MATDLERAVEMLKRKSSAQGRLWSYYQGDQPVVYTAKRLQKIFEDVDARFVENWCAVVVDSALDRIQLRGLRVDDARTQAVLDDLWAANDLNLEADDAHEGALVAGEAYLIVWDEGDGVECYFNDSRMCHLFYDPARPRLKKFAAKWWDDEGTRKLTLYYADRLEYYACVTANSASELNAKAFVPVSANAENPYGEVPVFHLRTGRLQLSELNNAVPLQNGVNKLLIDMMVAAEYGAFKQRYVISHAENLGQLKNAPNEVWDIPASDGLGQQTQVGEFSSTELRNYFEAIDRLAVATAIITRTPKHYFFQQSGDPSGEALLALEAPLNKKCEKRIERFTPTWQKAAAFMLKVAGVEAQARALRPWFELPQTVQPLTRAQARTFDVSSGVPLVTVLRREGWDQAELTQMETDRQDQAVSDQVGLASALVEAQRRMDRGGQQ